MIADVSRRTGQPTAERGFEKATEGGEWIFVPGHRQAHFLVPQLDRIPESQRDTQGSIDGFTASNTHMHRYS